MTKWQEVRLGDVCKFQNGKKRPKEPGKYPVFGGNGILDYTNQFNSNVGVIVGRVGAYCGSVFLSKEKCWVSDNAILGINTSDTDIIYLYYLLKSLNLNAKHIGSGQPLITQDILNNIKIFLPPLDVQKKIAGVLGALDDKIELNNKINNNLEQQAQALFKSWFVDFEPFGGKMPDDWKVGKLGDFIEIKRGGSPRPIQEYLVPNGLNWLKISDATAETSPYILEIKEHIKPEGLNKTVFLKKGSLVLSNSATPGIPKFLDIDTCIHDGWLYFPNSLFSNEYLFLLFNHIRKDLISIG